MSWGGVDALSPQCLGDLRLDQSGIDLCCEHSGRPDHAETLADDVALTVEYPGQDAARPLVGHDSSFSPADLFRCGTADAAGTFPGANKTSLDLAESSSLNAVINKSKDYS